MTNRLFYIAQYFTPEPYLKDIEFIRELKNKGWDPVVITGFPNYPHGKIYKGYRNRLFSEEMLDGIRVVRVFTYADHSTSSLKRGLNYLVFGVFAAIAVLKYGRYNSFYYILQSSPFVVLCAWAVKIFKSDSRTLLDIQDVFPENIRASGFVKSQWMTDGLDRFLDRFYYSSFDLFVTVSESFRRLISEKKIPLNRILTLYNWSMVEKDPRQDAENYLFNTEGFNIVYAGNIGVHQGLSKLVEGMASAVKNNPQVFFHFFGDGTDYAALQRKVHGNGNIVLHGRMPSVQIAKYLHAADALFLHLIKDPIYRCIIPSKLQAYIEVGKPLLAGVEGEAREIVQDNQLGEVFESENVAEFERAVLLLTHYSAQNIAEIRQRSLNLYAEKFSRAACSEKVHQFICKNI